MKEVIKCCALCQLTWLSGDIIQDKLHVKQHATRWGAIYVKWQGTNEIACQATCYKGKIENLCQVT